MHLKICFLHFGKSCGNICENYHYTSALGVNIAIKDSNTTLEDCDFTVFNIVWSVRCSISIKSCPLPWRFMRIISQSPSRKYAVDRRLAARRLHLAGNCGQRAGRSTLIEHMALLCCKVGYRKGPALKSVINTACHRPTMSRNAHRKCLFSLL